MMHQVIEGDARTELAKLSDVDLIFASPPYDSIRTADILPPEYLPRLGEAAYNAVKEQGIAILVMYDGKQNGVLSGTKRRIENHWIDRVGWKHWGELIYSRHGRPGRWGNHWFRRDHEYIMQFVKFEGKGTVKPRVHNRELLKIPAIHAGTKWHGTQTLSDGTRQTIEPKVQSDTKCRGTVWHYNTSNTEPGKQKLKHPSTMPQQLAEDIIRCFTNPGDLVVDPFGGSGTTAVAAKKLGRRSISIEIKPKWCRLIRQRLSGMLEVEYLEPQQ